MLGFNLLIALLIVVKGLDASTTCTYPPTSLEVIPHGPPNPAPTERSRNLVSWEECNDCPTCTGLVKVAPVLHCDCSADPQCQPFGYFDGIIKYECPTANPFAQIFMTTINGNTYAVIGKNVKLSNNPTNPGVTYFFYSSIFVAKNAVSTRVLSSPGLNGAYQCNNAGTSNFASFEDGLLNVTISCSTSAGNNFFNGRLQVQIDYIPEINSVPSGFCLDQAKRCSTTAANAWNGLVNNRNPSGLDIAGRTAALIFNGVSTPAGFGELQYAASAVGSYSLDENMVAPFSSNTARFWEWRIQYIDNTCVCDPAKFPTPTFPANYQCCLFHVPADIKRCQKAKHPAFYA